MRENSENVIVQFFANGERYALRLWSHVPRVGDEVMLEARRESSAGRKIAFNVKRVVWGVEADTDPYQAVNVEIEQSN